MASNPISVPSSHSCPVCGHAEQLRPLCIVNGYDVFACSHCGADHVYPAPTDAALKTYYDRPEWFEGGEAGGYDNYDAQTAWSTGLMDDILKPFSDRADLSVLDIGCGYGTHLAAAAKSGWKCFGVELSDHARTVAQQRLGSAAHIVGDAADLIPHEFDLVLMLDTIEHLDTPYTLLYQLFAIGAITAKTQVVITTPNAGSREAQAVPADWAYRHPPSHLVYYRGESLELLLKRLRFTQVTVAGLHGPQDNTDLALCAGLMVKASGSDFTEFMRERYVPGTWSKIAAYEHFPRYALASRLAKGKQVIDFGCGTGYGSAMLAAPAAGVTGLDIDASAIDWARQSHRNTKLKFHPCADLGTTLPAATFDLATCFEMIEHVDHATQKATVASIARMLRPEGVLVISTPNPEITKLYGANPYHLREMTEPEFLELLNAEFPNVRIYRQLVRNSITFLAGDENGAMQTASMQKDGPKKAGLPIAYIALCSKQALPELPDLTLFDDDVDLVGEFLGTENKLNTSKMAAYTFQDKTWQLELSAAAQQREVTNLNDAVTQKNTALDSQGEEIQRLHHAYEGKNRELASQGEDIHRLNRAYEGKNLELASQGEEIHRLNSACADKDLAIAEQQTAIAVLVQTKDALELRILAAEQELQQIKQTNWFKVAQRLKLKATGPRGNS